MKKMEILESTKILITGCGGMLGDAFYKYYSNKSTVLATDIDLNRPWLKYMDVREKQEVETIIKDFQPDLIFHLAALTDLEYCETHPDECYLTNSIGTENIATLCKKYEIPLLYICTAGIFDGKKDEYDDWDTPNPINVYGRSKWIGEDFISKNLNEFFICRAGWMMGGGPEKDKKFVNKIIKQIRNGNKKLYVVDDKLGTPTYTHDFAKNVHNLIESNNYGIFNMICDGNCSRYDVAEEIVKILNQKDEIALEKVSSNYFKKEYFAPRPFSEKLIPYKLKLRKIYTMKHWKVSLKEYLNKNFSDLIS